MIIMIQKCNYEQYNYSYNMIKEVHINSLCLLYWSWVILLKLILSHQSTTFIYNIHLSTFIHSTCFQYGNIIIIIQGYIICILEHHPIFFYHNTLYIHMIQIFIKQIFHTITIKLNETPKWGIIHSCGQGLSQRPVYPSFGRAIPFVDG